MKTTKTRVGYETAADLATTTPRAVPVGHRRGAVATAAVLLAVSASARGQGDVVVVTGSVAERALAEAPFAISSVDAETLRAAGPLINLSEAMARVPGLVVANRGNYAQDLQISSRGFGARAGFGVRGVRLYVDGIPASGPDGQGQVSHVDLAGTARVEVLRGPFSVLYGNSSGGVIATFGAPVRTTRGEAAVDVGSFGLRQWRVQGETPLGAGFTLRAGWQSMRIDGFRPHSAAERELGNVRLGWQGATDTVVALASRLDQPADDPLGLTRAQFDADPRQTAPQALQFDTRKTTRQTQTGMRWQHRFADAGALRESSVAVYDGRREVVQFLAIPPATQAPARNGGAVIDFDRRYRGAEARLRWAWDTVDLTAGVTLDRQRDDRLGFENFTGSGSTQVLGVVGALRRDEVNRADSRDAYALAEWAFAPAFGASVGVRSGRVRLQAADAYLSNGDDSGRRDFDYTNPVLGLRWQPAKGLNLHASLARGFESPTLGELAYRRDGSGGFNTDLQPQTSRQAEIGAKWRAPGWAVDAAWFDVRVADEIAVATNSGGRASFQNVGRTQRRGGELALRWTGPGGLGAALSATRLAATYRDPFLVCAAAPCTTPTLRVDPGNRIAGTARRSAFAELSWGDAAWGRVALEVRGSAATAVDDRNTAFSPGYAVAALRWQRGWAVGAGWRLDALVRVDNLADRQYVGSVIVNDANGRFYEPGAPRGVSVGLRLSAD